MKYTVLLLGQILIQYVLMNCEPTVKQSLLDAKLNNGQRTGAKQSTV